ncbi:MAG: hypothetical protein HZB25_08850 [Candidatus Eisenbacteria bacterium]|nr:hypothetical protein [Candidatus Eisenbacteria bacterium]
MDLLARERGVTAFGVAWRLPGLAPALAHRRLDAAGRRALRAALAETVPGSGSPFPLHRPSDPWRACVLLVRVRAALPPGRRAALRRVAASAARSAFETWDAARRAHAWAVAGALLEEGLLTVAGDGAVTAASDSAAHILGVPAAGLVGLPLAAALGQDAGFPWPLAPGVALEVRAPHPTGHSLALVLRAVPLGRGAGHAVVISDRSQERRAQEQARRRDRLAVLGELSAGVAHEIRNPLAGIATSAQVLRNRLEEGDDRRRFLDVIQDEVNRLDRIVSGLLDYARPWTLTLRRVSLPDCARKALALVADAAGRQGVVIEFQEQDPLPEVFADGDQLIQVLLNVFRNALEAMPRGGKLTLDARLAESPPFIRRTGGRRAEDSLLPQGPPAAARPVVRLRVSDTGEGILAEHLPRLFDPFFTTRATGTGLGLAICQSIIHEHGGSISAESTPGRGTTITLELPLEKRHGQRRKDG